MIVPESTAPNVPPVEPALALRESWQAEIAGRRQIGDVALSHFQEPLMLRTLDRTLVSDMDEVAVRYAAMHNLVRSTSHTSAEYADMTSRIWAIEAEVRTQQPIFEGNPPLAEDANNTTPLTDARPIVLADPKIQEMINSRNLGSAHEALLQQWPEFVAMYTAGTHAGVELGYIPTEVEARLEADLTQTSVRVIDDTLLQAVAPWTFAYYNNTTDEIGVTHKNGATGRFAENLAHEFVHKLSGGTFRHPENDEATEFNRPRVGFSNELVTKALSRGGLNEAVTHHVTLGIITGDFETINPDNREADDYTYYGYRRVLGDFVDKSQGSIRVSTLTNALFEDTGTEGKTSLRREFVQQAVRTYGIGALTKLEALMDLTDFVDQDDFEAVILSRIHPPETNESGLVLKPGYIDIEKLPTVADLLQS